MDKFDIKEWKDKLALEEAQTTLKKADEKVKLDLDNLRNYILNKRGY